MWPSALELSTAGHDEHELTLEMANGFLLGGGPDNEDFRSRLRNKAQDLETALTKVAHQDKAANDMHMNEHDFVCMGICQAGHDASQHARDSNTVPTSLRFSA
jgi:hypothetical protein